jgi:hypothetical protein
MFDIYLTHSMVWLHTIYVNKTCQILNLEIFVYRTRVTSQTAIRSASENTGLFISPSGISELDCATTKADTAQRSISIGRKSLQVPATRVATRVAGT